MLHQPSVNFVGTERFQDIIYYISRSSGQWEKKVVFSACFQRLSFVPRRQRVIRLCYAKKTIQQIRFTSLTVKSSNFNTNRRQTVPQKKTRNFAWITTLTKIHLFSKFAEIINLRRVENFQLTRNKRWSCCTSDPSPVSHGWVIELN